MFHIATLVSRALAEVCSVPVLLVFNSVFVAVTESSQSQPLLAGSVFMQHRWKVRDGLRVRRGGVRRQGERLLQAPPAHGVRDRAPGLVAGRTVPAD